MPKKEPVMSDFRDKTAQKLSDSISTLTKSIKQLSMVTVKGAGNIVRSTAGTIKSEFGIKPTNFIGSTFSAFNPVVGHIVKTTIDRNGPQIMTSVRSMMQSSKELVNDMRRKNKQEERYLKNSTENISKINARLLQKQTDVKRIRNTSVVVKKAKKRLDAHTSYNNIYGSDDVIQAIDRMRVSNAEWIKAAATMTPKQLKMKKLPKAATGGYVRKTGHAVVHKGEMILPQEMMYKQFELLSSINTNISKLSSAETKKSQDDMNARLLQKLESISEKFGDVVVPLTEKLSGRIKNKKLLFGLDLINSFIGSAREQYRVKVIGSQAYSYIKHVQRKSPIETIASATSATYAHTRLQLERIITILMKMAGTALKKSDRKKMRGWGGQEEESALTLKRGLMRYLFETGDIQDIIFPLRNKVQSTRTYRSMYSRISNLGIPTTALEALQLDEPSRFPKAARGGYVSRTGKAIVHRGEMITSASYVKKIVSYLSGIFTILKTTVSPLLSSGIKLKLLNLKNNISDRFGTQNNSSLVPSESIPRSHSSSRIAHIKASEQIKNYKESIKNSKIIVAANKKHLEWMKNNTYSRIVDGFKRAAEFITEKTQQGSSALMDTITNVLLFIGIRRRGIPAGIKKATLSKKLLFGARNPVKLLKLTGKAFKGLRIARLLGAGAAAGGAAAGIGTTGAAAAGVAGTAASILGSPVLLASTIIVSLIDGLVGFFTAGKIFNLASKDVNIRHRMSAFFAGVIDGLWMFIRVPFNLLAKLVGSEFRLGSLIKPLSKFFYGITEVFKKLITPVVHVIKPLIDNVVLVAKMAFKIIKTGIANVIDIIAAITYLFTDPKKSVATFAKVFTRSMKLMFMEIPKFLFKFSMNMTKFLFRSVILVFVKLPYHLLKFFLLKLPYFAMKTLFTLNVMVYKGLYKLLFKIVPKLVVSLYNMLTNFIKNFPSIAMKAYSTIKRKIVLFLLDSAISVLDSIISFMTDGKKLQSTAKQIGLFVYKRFIWFGKFLFNTLINLPRLSLLINKTLFNLNMAIIKFVLNVGKSVFTKVIPFAIKTTISLLTNFFKTLVPSMLSLTVKMWKTGQEAIITTIINIFTYIKDFIFGWKDRQINRVKNAVKRPFNTTLNMSKNYINAAKNLTGRSVNFLDKIKNKAVNISPFRGNNDYYNDLINNAVLMDSTNRSAVKSNYELAKSTAQNQLIHPVSNQNNIVSSNNSSSTNSPGPQHSRDPLWVGMDDLLKGNI